jgi:hypothetical protein
MVSDTLPSLSIIIIDVCDHTVGVLLNPRLKIMESIDYLSSESIILIQDAD